jgi:hypothetical protein
MKVVNIFSRGLGALAGAALAPAWVYAVWLPAGGIELTGTSFVVGLALALAALIAVIAAVRGHAAVVMLVFVASFFPVGAVLVTAEHWLRWIGVLDVGLFVSAVGMWLSARLGERVAPSA